MRVLELINESTLGGGQTHVLDLARGLKARGTHDVMVGATGTGALHQAVQGSGIPFVPLPGGFLPKLAAIRSVVREHGVGVVHTHGGVAGLWGRLAARGRAKLVHTLHGIHYLNYDSAVTRWAYARLDGWLAGSTDRVICVCASDRARAVAAGVVVPDRVRVVLNGIDVDRFTSGLEPPASRLPPPASSLQPPASTLFTIGCVARLHRQKGLPILLEAMRTVLGELPDARLMLVGDGPEAAALRNRAAELGIAGRVLFPGAMPANATLYSGFDVLCLPSLWEGLPLVLLEAMAAGVPVVATAVDGSREVVRDGTDGLLVPPRDPGALAAALVRLGRDPGLRARLAAAGAERVRSAFTLERMVRETEAIYDELR